MKNILLVEPKSSDVNIFSIFKIPRMGLAILGTAAKTAGYNVKIIYQEVTPLTHQDITWADLVGFSLTTSTAPEGYRLARLVRTIDGKYGKSTTIVFGGVHPTFEPEEALDHGDFVLRGEADETFVQFLDALASDVPGGNAAGPRVSTIPGLSFRRGDGIVHNSLPDKRVDMDTVPTPDWSLFENYKPSIGIVMTSRGCPYDCSFCSVTAMLGRVYRMRSIDLIMADLAEIRTKSVFFYDDHFTANKERTKTLLRRIIDERNVTHHVRHFSAQVRSDIAKDPELLDLMKAAGFTTFYIGFESINPKTLEIYNKKQTLDDIEFSIAQIHQRGIEIHGMFVFGSDADKKETFIETTRFARKNRIETVQFLILTPLPGTEHYRQLESEGRIVCRDWNRFDAFNAVFLPRNMTPYNLQIFTIRAMKRFYSIWRSIKFLVTGKIRLSLFNAYGLFSLFIWSKRNRTWLARIKKDSCDVFVPEFMRVTCPVR